MARLVLVGLPGTGKTSLAKALALRWGVEAIDTDDALATMVGHRAPDYLRQVGEEEFRQREYDVLRRVLESDGVVATGGGGVTLPQAREQLRAARTYWLDCSDEVILTRVSEGDRPLLHDDPRGTLARLRAQREPWYREVSRVRIDTSGPFEDVVTSVLSEVEGEYE